jgi:hypothetical protein
MPARSPAANHSAATAALIAQRRQYVARMRLRHVSVRDIQKALGQQFPNPETGQPWSLGCIQKDCMALKLEWQASAAADTAEHQAALLAELREARREAWQEKALDLVLRGIKQEADLLGLNAPKQIDLTLRVKALAAALGIDEALALAEAERVIGEHQRGPLAH